jgi:hypothetical protein
MKVDIYVSEKESSLPRYSLLRANSPPSLLPSNERWTYLRSGDTREFHLPEAVEQEIERLGIWAHTFGDGAGAARRPTGGG